MSRAYILTAAVLLAGCAATPTLDAGPAACIPAAPTIAIRPARPELAVYSLPAQATTAEQQEALVLSLRQCVGYALTLEQLTKEEK